MKNSDKNSDIILQDYQTWLGEDTQSDVMWPNYAKCIAEI